MIGPTPKCMGIFEFMSNNPVLTFILAVLLVQLICIWFMNDKKEVE